MDAVVMRARYVTLAMSQEDHPYLVVLTHGYDPGSRRLYFHCAEQGRKRDILTTNPSVWGIAVEDLGYQHGACDHAYRSVMFGGTVRFVHDNEEKRRALTVMINHQEREPHKVIAEQLTPARVAAVTVGCVEITFMSGKDAAPRNL